MRSILVFVLTFAFFYFYDNETVAEEITQQRYERSIYFKMPLDSIEYHWEFLDRKDFLNGELVLSFTSEGKRINEIIFSHGKINPGWEVVGKDDAYDAEHNTIYFGFVSKDKYWLNLDDSAKITFNNPHNQKGWGADFKADFKPGKYEANAEYFSLYEDDTYDTEEELAEACAYVSVEDWKEHWPLVAQIKPGWSEN